MMAKMTSKNQLTLPKAILREVPPSTYFDVRAEGGRIVLSPVVMRRADEVREKLAELGLTETDTRAAVAWARRKK